MNTTTKMRCGAQETVNSEGGMQSSQLMKLFEDELKDLYWAEKAISKAGCTFYFAVSEKQASINEQSSERHQRRKFLF